MRRVDPTETHAPDAGIGGWMHIEDSQARSPGVIAEAYVRDGYVIFPSLLDQQYVDRLHRGAAEFWSGERGSFAGACSCGGAPSGRELRRLCPALHCPHQLSPLLRRCAKDPRVRTAFTMTIGSNLKQVLSALLLTQPGAPGQAWHQDEACIPTRDRSLCGMWVALDDFTVNSGCMWFLPGSHSHGVLWPQRQLRHPDFDLADKTSGYPYAPDHAVAVEVPAGSVVIYDGHLLHQSRENATTDRFRHALIFYYARP